jgi:hypothetical protein
MEYDDGDMIELAHDNIEYRILNLRGSLIVGYFFINTVTTNVLRRLNYGISFNL